MRKIVWSLITSTFLLSTSPPISAQSAIVSPYAGEEAREIAALSQDDIAELLAGGGWGFARPAELNGMPGPRHVLDAREALDLTEAQATRIQAIFDDMHATAVDLGARFVDLEGELNDAFRAGDIDVASLETRVEEIAMVSARLRVAHLAAHLRTRYVLNDAQIATYNQLRGYADEDAAGCAPVPAGHDPQMWRRHNTCD